MKSVVKLVEAKKETVVEKIINQSQGILIAEKIIEEIIKSAEETKKEIKQHTFSILDDKLPPLGNESMQLNNAREIDNFLIWIIGMRLS